MTEPGVIPHHQVTDCGAHHAARTNYGDKYDLFCEKPHGHPGPHGAELIIFWPQEATVPP